MTGIVKKVFRGAKSVVKGVVKVVGKTLSPVVFIGKKIARPILKGIGSIFGGGKKEDEPEQLGTDTQTAAQRLARSREDQLQAALLSERSGRRSGRAGFRLGRNLLKFNRRIRTN